MKKVISFVLGLGVLMCTSLTGCGNSEQTSGGVVGTADDPKTVEIAILTGMAPYTFVDESGNYKGYDYEFLTMVDEMVPEYKFHYNAVEPDAAAAAVQAGTYALSCSAHFVTPAREENFILSYPESYYPVNLISRKEDSFKKFEDLDGKSIVPDPPNDGLYVVLHKMSEEKPEIKFKEEEVSNYIPYADCCKQVSNGQYDCWFGGDTMFKDVMEAQPMDNLYCSEPIYCAGCVTVINKDYKDLRDKINESIIKLYKDGKLSELSKKWLGKDVWEIAKKTGALDEVFTK